MEKNRLDTLSEQLYRYLCVVIGSEKVVKARRLFFDVLGNAVNTNPVIKVIYSGSKAEGLNLVGSDIDIMFMDNGFPVYNDISQMPDTCTRTFYMLLDTVNAPPGFARIQLNGLTVYDLKIVECLQKEYPHIVLVDDGCVFSNESYRLYFQNYFGKLLGLNKTLQQIITPNHGPCLSLLDEAFDYVTCYNCNTWPDIALGWLIRPRSAGWPSQHTIDLITNDNVLLVPIGSKFGSSKDNPYEYRISFSTAEKILIHSYNHTQLLCYALLKLVLKEVIDKTENVEKLLCSYFIKTVMFWVIEENGCFAWKPNNLLKVYNACLRKLLYFIIQGYCPNYFIPENNMFEGKILGDAQSRLSIVLERIVNDGINIVWKTTTLSGFLKETKNTSNNETDMGIYPFLHLLDGNCADPFSLYKAISDIIQCDKHGVAKHLYFLWFVQICRRLGMESKYDIQKRNVDLHKLYKQSLYYLLIASHGDTISGWLWVAAFFYQHSQVLKSLHVLEFVTSECAYSRRWIGQTEKFLDQNVYPRDFSFLQRYRLSYTNVMKCFTPMGTLFAKSDLQVHDYGIVVSPYALVHFLYFICYKRTGNYRLQRIAIQNLQSVFMEDTTPDIYTFAPGLPYILKAHTLSNYDTLSDEVISELFSKMIVLLNRSRLSSPFLPHVDVFLRELKERLRW